MIGKIVIKQTEYGIHKQFQELWDKEYPNWKDNDKLKELNIELWKCLLTEQTDKVIEQILKKISPECKLSIQSILDYKK